MYINVYRVGKVGEVGRRLHSKLYVTGRQHRTSSVPMCGLQWGYYRCSVGTSVRHEDITVKKNVATANFS